MKRRAHVHVGVAIGSGRIAARRTDAPQVWSVDVTDADLEERLEQLFDQMRRSIATDAHRTTLYVALLPPLADLRVVELPRMSAPLARLAVLANVARYFPAAGPDSAVGVHSGRVRRGVKSRVLVACAHAPLVRDLENAASRAGCDLALVTAAGAAWAGAPGEGWRMARVGARIEAVRAGDGVVQSVRRMLPSATDEEIASALGSVPTTIDAWEAAAQGAPFAVGPELMSETRRAAHERGERRRALGLAAAACASLVLSAALFAHGLDRELEAVRGYRATIRPAVERTLEAHAAIESAEARARSFGQVATQSPRWARTLAALAQELPSDAYVASLSAVADSMTLEIVTGDAASAFEAVRAVPGVVSVRALSPVRREERPDGSFAEALELAAVFRPEEVELQ